MASGVGKRVMGVGIKARARPRRPRRAGPRAQARLGGCSGGGGGSPVKSSNRMAPSE